MFDMIKMMGKLKDAQEKLKEANEQLALLKHTAESGAGLVVATVTGKRQIIKLQIDDSLLSDKTMLQDLVIAALNKALSEADVLARQELQKSTKGILPEIPGLDFNNLV
jgi:nucleoid-associated protein EbfC